MAHTRVLAASEWHSWVVAFLLRIGKLNWPGCVMGVHALLPMCAAKEQTSTRGHPHLLCFGVEQVHILLKHAVELMLIVCR